MAALVAATTAASTSTLPYTYADIRRAARPGGSGPSLRLITRSKADMPGSLGSQRGRPGRGAGTSCGAGGTRTHTGTDLNRVPLPIGLRPRAHFAPLQPRRRREAPARP